MGTFWCREDGGHEVPVPGLRPSAGEMFCPKPEHEGARLTAKPKDRKPLKRGSTSQTAAYYRALERFNHAVKSRRCFFAGRRPGHECIYPLDAHHLVPKDWLKRELGFEEAELLVVMFDPILGEPACRAAHEAIELRSDYIYFDELNADVIALCERVDAQRPNQPSMLDRLRVESPERSADPANPNERITHA